MSDIETDRLVQEASVGGAVAVDQLLERFLPELQAFVRLRVGPGILRKESEEDVVQSVCREVLGDVSSFDYRGVPAFKKWLYTAALRKIYDKAKFYKREMRDVAREEMLATNPQYYTGYASLLTPTRAAVVKEDVAQLEAAFDKLPRDYAEVITLNKLCGLSHAEIAQEMGRSVEATRVLLHRALARLGTLITPE